MGGVPVRSPRPSPVPVAADQLHDARREEHRPVLPPWSSVHHASAVCGSSGRFTRAGAIGGAALRQLREQPLQLGEEIREIDREDLPDPYPD